MNNQETTQQVPQPLIRDQDLPGLPTAFYDTAVVLNHISVPLDLIGTRVLKQVEMSIADLCWRLSLSLPDVYLEVLRERCRHAPPYQYLEAWVCAHAALSERAGKDGAGDPFWQTGGQGEEALRKTREAIDATWYAYLAVLSSWAEAYGEQFLTIIDQAMEFLTGFVNFEGEYGDLEAAYDGLRMACDELVGGCDGETSTRERVS